MRTSWILIAAAYVAAMIVALIVGYVLRSQQPLLVIGGADVAATIVIFIFSVATNNSSCYDPYWSVAPVPIAVYWLLQPGTDGLTSPRHILVFALLCFWAIRLTINWAVRWHGITDEDWRYREFRGQFGLFYWPLSFVGIHLMPTIMVFLGCLALWPALAAGTRPLSWLDGLAAVLTLGAILLELVADVQMNRYRQTNHDDRVVPPGVWSLSRHPNYLGEVTFWWGLFFFGLAATPNYTWTIIGPLAIFLLFIFVSIPLMERHLRARRPTYALYAQRVAPFFPWPRSAPPAQNEPEVRTT